jgi:hypothetical protein
VRTASRRSRRARTSSRISWGRESTHPLAWPRNQESGASCEGGAEPFRRQCAVPPFGVEDLVLGGLVVEIGFAVRGSCSTVAGRRDQMARNKKKSLNTCS